MRKACAGLQYSVTSSNICLRSRFHQPPMMTRVYIVEDHPVMRESLTEFLGATHGVVVVGAARSAEDALHGIPDADPSLVLLDLGLPGEDGYALMDAIRERWELPFVVLTGQEEPGSVERAFAAGARGYVQKGRPREIVEAIRRAAGGETYLSDSLRDDSDPLQDDKGLEEARQEGSGKGT